MPFSPSDFAWWVWLLFAAGAAVVCFVCYLIIQKWEDNVVYVPSIVVFFAACGVGGICLLIAVIRFVKWVWVS